MEKCLVLGGNGFLGSHLAERLVMRGYSVRIFDNFPSGQENIKKLLKDIETIRGDFLDETDIRSALKGIDYVFHYISTTVPATAAKDPVYDIESNVIGSLKLIQLAAASQVKKIIFPSSGGTIYGEPASLPVCEASPLDPADPYAISKLAVEKYLRYFHQIQGLDYLIIRYSNPYGERQNPRGQQGVIPIFLNRIKAGEQPFIYGDGSMVRDYIYIQDAIQATIEALETESGEKIYNIGSGEGSSLNALIDIMSRVVGKTIRPQYLPQNRIFVQKIILDITKIQKATGWRPDTEIEEGIRRTWEWIKHS
jgi:UDP-glucose 4-epimerase